MVVAGSILKATKCSSSTCTPRIVGSEAGVVVVVVGGILRAIVDSSNTPRDVENKAALVVAGRVLRAIKSVFMIVP